MSVCDFSVAAYVLLGTNLIAIKMPGKNMNGKLTPSGMKYMRREHLEKRSS